MTMPPLAGAVDSWCDNTLPDPRWWRITSGPSGRREPQPRRPELNWAEVFGTHSLAGARVHKSAYTEAMNDDDSEINVRDARAHFAEVITRAQNGSPTVITRNREPVAAVVPIEDFNVLEDAIDRYFAREADRDLTENPDAPTYSMSEVVAAIFEEDTGRGAA